MITIEGLIPRPTVCSMGGQRRRRWADIDQTGDQCAGKYYFFQWISLLEMLFHGIECHMYNVFTPRKHSQQHIYNERSAGDLKCPHPKCRHAMTL